MDYSIETTGNLFHCVGNFAQGSTVACCLYSHLQQVAVVTAFGCASNSLQVSSNLFAITFCSQFFQAFDLRIAYSGIINGQYIQRVFLSQTILVQANDGFLAAIDISLTASCALFDTHLG